jgi:2-amino-4-hydroxy-6-hydroxymethyldihydropteridine diphosphokinase
MNGKYGHDVFLSIGSNIGNRHGYLQLAVNELKTVASSICCSSLYETEPVGNTGQDYFYNAAVRLCTDLCPNDMMKFILEIEQRAGRQRTIRFGPRTLDIDIIFYDQQIIHEAALFIPHPEYVHRRFVLTPLAEIAPEWICPVHKKTLLAMLNQCTDDKSVQLISDLCLDDGLPVNTNEAVSHG